MDQLTRINTLIDIVIKVNTTTTNYINGNIKLNLNDDQVDTIVGDHYCCYHFIVNNCCYRVIVNNCNIAIAVNLLIAIGIVGLGDMVIGGGVSVSVSVSASVSVSDITCMGCCLDHHTCAFHDADFTIIIRVIDAVVVDALSLYLTHFVLCDYYSLTTN